MSEPNDAEQTPEEIFAEEAMREAAEEAMREAAEEAMREAVELKVARDLVAKEELEASQIEPVTLYEHDCETCIYLGPYRDHDLYYHPGAAETVIARYGNGGSEYYSGIELSKLQDEEAAAKEEAAADPDSIFEPDDSFRHVVHLLAVAANRMRAWKRENKAHESALK